jgi:hypothetical protein
MGMKTSNRLSVKSGSSGLGLTTWAVVYLLMDRWQPPGWVWGTVGTFVALIMIVGVRELLTAKRFVITDDGKLVRED